MKPRFYVPLWLALLILLAGACGVDSAGMGAGGDGGGQAASSAPEVTGMAQAALTAGAGSVGNCNGNPARCAAVNVAAGYGHTVALQSDGTVWDWGLNDYGQLGDTTTTTQYVPEQVSGLGSVTAVAAGYSHTVALKSDGTVWDWGDNQYGQLPRGRRARGSGAR